MSHTLKQAIRKACRGTKVAPTVAAVVLASIGTGVQAQQEEEVVVTGIRASLDQSMDIKRNSTAVVDAITAEDIGKFPDKNVAESLSRITGVGVSREYGEGEKIVVRGASPETNRTLLNGQTVASADWFILDTPGRSFNYTLLPSVLVGNLEVYKSPYASMDEGSIGGTVVLRTRKPLNLESNTINVSVEGQYSETSEEMEPQISGLYSFKNDDETFGVLLSGVHQERTLVREGIEILGWRTQEATGEKVVSHIGIPRFEQSRERDTVFGSVQYAPTESLDITLNALKSKMEADNHNQNWLIMPNNDYEEIENKVVENGNVLAGTVTDGATEFDFINRRSSSETQSIDLDVTYTADALTVHGQIGSTKAEGGTYREASFSALPIGVTSYDFDLRGTPEVNTYTEGFDDDMGASNPEAFAPGWIWGGKKPTTDEETYAQLDFTIPLEMGAFTAIRTGVKLRDAERTQDRVAFSWHGPNTTDPSQTDAGSYLDYVFQTCTTLATCGLGVGSPESIDVLANGNMTYQMYQDQEAFERVAFEGLNGVPADYAQSLFLPEIWKVNEKHTALYVQGDFAGEKFRGNVGVRYVSTEQSSGGYEFVDPNGGYLTIDREWLVPVSYAWVEADNDYSEILPSANFAYDLTDEQVFRASAARVMARQNWNDIATTESYGSLNQANPSGTRSNPFLDPRIADQLDLAWEWYFAEHSMVSATYFFKKIKSYRSYETFVEPRLNEETEEFVDVAFKKPFNGEGGTTNGLELSYQQDFGGFGTVVNYTYTDAGSDQERDDTIAGSGLVEGTSEHMLNLTGYYENDSVSARLMYNYRSEWYKGLHFNGDELWNDTYGQWDASVSYNVTDYMTLSLEAVNLLDEEIVEYNTDKARVMSLYQNGRRFVAGVQLKF
ncbi:TonB-dependent receptor [Teredinibacter turnerae]|uniref:TonB-dependent receptor n=1 Tax=Teredinibacter turnerae TaxID=2426 RepID=UPI0030D51C68